MSLGATEEASLGHSTCEDSKQPRELLVLPSLTVDGKMLVACSKIRQRAFDEGSIS